MTEKFFSTFNFNCNTFEITFILLFILQPRNIIFQIIYYFYPEKFQIFYFWFSPLDPMFYPAGRESEATL